MHVAYLVALIREGTDAYVWGFRIVDVDDFRRRTGQLQLLVELLLGNLRKPSRLHLDPPPPRFAMGDPPLSEKIDVVIPVLLTFEVYPRIPEEAANQFLSDATGKQILEIENPILRFHVHLFQ